MDRPTAAQYIIECVRKKHVEHAKVIVRRGRTDFVLDPDDLVPEQNDTNDVVITVREG